MQRNMRGIRASRALPSILSVGIVLAVLGSCMGPPAVRTPGDDTARSGFARLNSDGSLDTTFNPGSGANYVVQSIVPQADGKVVIGGGFSRVNGANRSGIARLNSDGSLDESFDPGSGIEDVEHNEPWVDPIAIQPDGKLLIGGNFTHMNGVSRSNIARLNSDGSIDESFDAIARNGAVASIIVQPDGKVIIAGLFTEVNGVSLNRIARLNSDGSLDESFDPGSGTDFTINSVVLQGDGKLLLGGFFSEADGVSRISIARLHSDGSIDLSFDPGTGASDPDIWTGVSELALQEDGKVLVGGSFTEVDGVSRPYVARLNSDGSVDESFAARANESVSSIVVQPDGKILIGGGFFTEVDGVRRGYIARLNHDGSLDTSFDPGAGANEGVFSVALQEDGKVLLSGWFTRIGP